MNDELLTLKAYVDISTYRQRVMKTLKENEVLIPTRIAKNCGLRPNHISNTLKELRQNELIECINPEVRKGRLYRLTDKGNKIMEEL